MAIENATLTSGTGFVLAPMNLTDTQKTLVSNIIENIHGNESGIENLATESQEKLNEVISAVNSLKEGTDTDIATLEDNINAILYLESEAGNDSFVGLFTKLYTAINEKKEALAFILDVESSENGQVLLDLSAYGFTSMTEYEVLPSMVTDDTGRSLSVDFKKVNQNGGILTIRDKDRLQFGDNAEARYDAAVKGEVQVTVVIVRTASPIKADLTEVDGDHVHLGHSWTEHIVITRSEVDGERKVEVAISKELSGLEYIIEILDADDTLLERVNGTVGSDGSVIGDRDLPDVGTIKVTIDGQVYSEEA